MDYRIEDQYTSIRYELRQLIEMAGDVGERAILRYVRPLEATKNFFIHCYQFKDWLKASTQKNKCKDIEKYVKNDPLRKACIICNSLKHGGELRNGSQEEKLVEINLACKLDVPPMKDGKAYISAEQNPRDGDTIEILSTQQSLKKGKAISSYKVIITIGIEKYNALELAVDCMAAWDRYLLEHGIFLNLEDGISQIELKSKEL